MPAAVGIVTRLDRGMWPNTYVLRGHGTQFAAHDPAGAVSLKSVLSGSARWSASGRTLVLSEGMHLLLNEGEYAVEIDSPAVETTTLCVFFEPDFLEDIRRTLLAAALDPEELAPVEWQETIEPWNPRVWPLLQRLDSEGPSTELLLTLGESLVANSAEAGRTIDALPAARAATRAEIYRRVLRGRDFLLSSLTERPTMRDAARAAAMSPYHFHRAFRSVFGQPPHRYVLEQKLRRAMHLLRTTRCSVTEISLESGFESVPSFTAAFRRRFGAPPGSHRRA